MIQRGYIFYATYRWLCWSSTSINKDSSARELVYLAIVQAYFQRLWTCKTRLSHQKVKAFSSFNRTQVVDAKYLDDVAFALPHLGHLYCYWASLHPEVSTTPC